MFLDHDFDIRENIKIVLYVVKEWLLNDCLCIDRLDVECDAYVPVRDSIAVCARCYGSVDHGRLHSRCISRTTHGPRLDNG